MESSTCHPFAEAHDLYERFPHLQRIETLWGSPECRAWLADLMLSDRDGSRGGFPPEYASIILRLLCEHDWQFPELDNSRPGTHGWIDPDTIRHRWR